MGILYKRFIDIFSRSLVSTATLYRRLASDSEISRESLRDAIREGRLCYVHWVDNFAKFYRASSVKFNSETLRQCLWTAHGVKVWPGDVHMLCSRVNLSQ